MDTVNLGLIGLGGWPREAYIPNLKKLPSAHVVAACAPGERSRAYAQEQFGNGLITYSDYRDLLADDEVEAVMIAVPNRLHSEVTIAAAQSGKHLFFEPPIGTNQQEIDATLAALQEAKGVVQIDHELRYAPVTRRVQQMLSEGAVGDPLSVKSQLWADWGFDSSASGGSEQPEGFFLWLGCWYLDLLDCIFAGVPLRADVFAGSAKHGGMADNGWALLQYPADKLGCWEFTMLNCEGQEVSLYVHGTEGELLADIWNGTIRWRNGGGLHSTGKAWREETVPCEQPPHGFAGMYESIAGFLEAVINGTLVAADLNVIRRVHAAAMACTTSYSEGGCVEVG